MSATKRQVPKRQVLVDGEYRVFGYLMDEDVLLKFALEQRLGTDEDDWERACAIARAAAKFLGSHKISPYRVAGVIVNGEVNTCAAIASEEESDHMPMPPRETIEKLKKIMHTSNEPRWYVHV